MNPILFFVLALVAVRVAQRVDQAQVSGLVKKALPDAQSFATEHAEQLKPVAKDAWDIAPLEVTPRLLPPKEGSPEMQQLVQAGDWLVKKYLPELSAKVPAFREGTWESFFRLADDLQ